MVKATLPQNLRGAHIHFVGIKGTGMAALAEILFHNGVEITGSDVSERFYTDEILEKLGIAALPFAKENVSSNTELVIYSSAYNPQTNPDLIAANELAIPCMLYTEALGAYSALAYSAGICGVHGKTSTTGLTGTILSQLELPCQILAGSIINSFDGKCTYTSPLFDTCDKEMLGCRNKFGMTYGQVQHDACHPELVSGSRKYFVAETCEYQRHFMSFEPKIIVLTSVESDHQDYFPTFKDIQNAFVDYICKLPQNGIAIFCADDEGAAQTINIAKEKRADIKFIPYGTKAQGEYHLEFGKTANEKNEFAINCIGNAFLRVPGKHEVLDAAAAVALACELLKADGKDPKDFIANIKAGLEKFSGGKRRSEIVGRAKNFHGDDIVFIDDYGHHPTAVQTTLSGFKEFYSGRKIIVDFMSHTYTRTAALLDEFAKSFNAADIAIINKIYGSAREDPSAANVTGKTLAEAAAKYHNDVRYKEEFDAAAEEGFSILSQGAGADYPNGYLFVTMGAGDNWKVGKLILEKFI